MVASHSGGRTVSVDRIRDRYHSDADRAQRSAQASLQFVIDNLTALKAATSRTPRMVEDARTFHHQVRGGGKLTPEQMDYVDKMYEKVMKGLGLDSVPTHHDLGPRR